MLATTRKKPLKKISEITFDLEIINPIESKNLFGGCTYSSGWDCGCGNNWNENPSWNTGGMGFIGFSSSGNSGNTDGGGSWSSGNDWQQYDNSYDNNHDSNGDGILDQDDLDNNGIKDDCLLTNLPLKIEQQIGNMCAFNALTLCANILGSNISLESMMTNIINNLMTNPNATGNNLIANGLNVQDIFIAINQVFTNSNVTNTNQIEAALCINQPVIAQFNGHAVVIVGYNSNNQSFTIADSQWTSNNGYHTIGYGSISEVFILTGIRP